MVLRGMCSIFIAFGWPLVGALLPQACQAQDNIEQLAFAGTATCTNSSCAAFGNGSVNGTYSLDVTTDAIVGSWSFSTPFGVISSSDTGASTLVYVESTGVVEAVFEVVTYNPLFDEFVFLRFPPGDTKQIGALDTTEVSDLCLNTPGGYNGSPSCHPSYLVTGANAGNVYFSFVSGKLTQISVGADGGVWGINGAQQIFTYNSSSQSWMNIPGALTQIAVGSSTAVWGLNENEQIYHWDPVHSQWINIPGSLAQIAIGADGDVWGLDSQSSIYHYNAQTGFFGLMSGQLAHIAVGSAGGVYGLNSAGGAFWYNPGTGYFEYLSNPAFTQISVGADGSVGGVSDGLVYGLYRGAWVPLGNNFAAAQIALGTGTSAYVLDTSGNIYYANGQTTAWDQISGTLSSIAVGGNGAVWGLNGAQEIFTLQNAPMRAYQTLTSIPGSLSQVSVGADGSVWGLSGNTVETFNPLPQAFEAVSGAPPLSQLSVGAGGDVWGVDSFGNIFQYDATSQTWNNIPGELNFVQVGANHSVWGINAAGQIFTYLNNSWTNIPGTLQTLSLGADGAVWGINAQQQIYRFDGQSWMNIPGSLAQIAVGNAANVWGINGLGEVYYYDNARGWVIIPGAYLTNISVAFDGTVWGVNASGNLYQWNASTQAFNFVGSGVTNVFVGNAAAVWALNTTTGTVASWF